MEQEFEPLNYGLHVTVFYPAKILFLFTIASNLWFHGNFSSACKSETTESPSKIWQAYFSILRNQGRNCLVLTDWSTVSNSKSFRTFQSNILIKTTLFIINACFTIIRSKKVQPIFSMLTKKWVVLAFWFKIRLMDLTNISKPHLPKLQIWDDFHSQKKGHFSKTKAKFKRKQYRTISWNRPISTVLLWNTKKVKNRGTSRLIAHTRFMNGKFNLYVLWSLAKRIQNWILYRSTTCDFTAVINIH